MVLRQNGHIGSFGPRAHLVLGQNGHIGSFGPRAHLVLRQNCHFGSFGPGSHLVPGLEEPVWLLWSSDGRGHIGSLRFLWSFGIIWSLIHLVPFHRGVRGHFYFRGSFGPFLPLVPFGPKECEGQRKRSHFRRKFRHRPSSINDSFSIFFCRKKLI